MTRTQLQNNAFYKYIRILAEALEAGGYDMREIIKVPIKPTMENVKSEIVDPVMKALYPEVDSSAKLTTLQIEVLYEVVNRATAQKLGISIEFPSNHDRGQNEDQPS
jgi:hypothetical protein